MSDLSQFSPFVQIKSGTQQPPIFIAHGLSGNVQFSELAAHIRTGHAIYAIQARGIDGKEEPLTTVQDMVSLYLERLPEVCPDGPYMLIGYSFGGLVALEMAQRLLRAGKRVNLLMLLDSFPHPRFMPLLWRVRLFARRMRIHALHMSDMPIRLSLSYLLGGLKRRLHLAGPLLDPLPETARASFEQTALRRVKEKAYISYTRYKPTFYPGKITLVATAEKAFFPGDPAAIWSSLSADLEVDVIPGTHLNIVTTEVKALGAVLTRHIQRCSASVTRPSVPEA